MYIIYNLRTDFVTNRLNYVSNLQNLYLLLKNIKLSLYYIVEKIESSKAAKSNRPILLPSYLPFSLEMISGKNDFLNRSVLHK